MTISTNCELLFEQIVNSDDKEAFHTFFHIFYPQLCLYAKRFIEDKSIREDIVQDLFVSIWEKRKSIILTSSIKGYLMSSVKNNCLKHIRKESYFLQYQKNTSIETPIYEEGLEKLYDLHELQALLEKALNKLPKEHRLAFIMSRLENHSTAEIAKVMNVSVRTVERYRNRAIEILKKEMKDYLPIILFILKKLIY